MSLFTVMDSPLWLTAGWTMLHFFWIGVLVGLFAWAGRKVLATASPGVRYLFAVCCLAGLAVAPGIIATQVYVPAFEEEFFEPESAAVSAVLVPVQFETETITESEPIAAITPISIPAIPQRNGFTQQLYSAVVWLPWVWFLGTPAVFALLATGLIGADRLRKQSQLLQEGPVFDACRKIAQSLKIARRVTVGICERLKTPILIGVIRPMILLPPAALAGWSPDQLEMVLLHELVHLRRWDNLVNLSQRVIESVLFFHPVVWWISSWVRLERELCCDAVVVRTTGRPQEYAETLAALSHSNGPRLHAAVAMAEHNTVTRIRRILNLEDTTMRLSRTALLLTIILMIAPAVLLTGYVAYGDSAETGSASPDESKQTSETDLLADATDQVKYVVGKRKLLVMSKRTGNFDIFLMNEDGSEAKNLTNHDAEDGSPDWSPDGKRIVFASNRNYKNIL
jgi:beta-lactamase regulating signal transducer with metallopeptidase domain